jgi:hypothetical protein
MALENSTQDGGMDADAFYAKAQEPNFPDEMAFQIKVANPEDGKTFSREGVEDTVDLMQGFIIARLLATWRKTGVPPQTMNMTLKIDWEYDPDIAAGFLPYFDADVKGVGLTQVDGEHRIARKRLDN